MSPGVSPERGDEPPSCVSRPLPQPRLRRSLEAHRRSLSYLGLTLCLTKRVGYERSEPSHWKVAVWEQNPVTAQARRTLDPIPEALRRAFSSKAGHTAGTWTANVPSMASADTKILLPASLGAHRGESSPRAPGSGTTAVEPAGSINARGRRVRSCRGQGA
jgi:hypothetical protein